uniref:Glutathione S-transferase n=1 Tax=Musca domestica TaxID=7370 RepID=A0A1I8N4F0_MUSDO
MESPKLEMLRSVKGKDMLLFDGYLYHYDDRTTKSYRWVCSRRKDNPPCRVRMHTSLIDEWDLTRHKLESIIGEHPHGPADEAAIIRAREKKRQADAENLPCTLSNKSLKRKYQMQKGGGGGGGTVAKKTKPVTDDEDNVSSIDGIIEMDSSFELMPNSKPAVGNKSVLMLKTAKGYHMIAVDGCVYRLDGKSMISCTYRWKCFRSKDLQCTGRIYTECLASGMHRYKPFRVDENEHNHQPYTEAKIEALIRRNNIQIIRGKEDNRKDGDELKATPYKKNAHSLPLSAAYSGGEGVLSISTNIELPETKHGSTGSRKDKAAATAAQYRYVKNPMEVFKNPQHGEVKLFSFLPSFKGNRVLILENMIYHFDTRGGRNGRIYWTCFDKVLRCNCRVTTENVGDKIQIVRVSGEHSHSQDHRQHIDKRIKKILSFRNQTGKLEENNPFGNDDDVGDDANPLFQSDEDNDDGEGDKEDREKVDFKKHKPDSTTADISELLRLNKLKKEKQEEILMEIPVTTKGKSEEEIMEISEGVVLAEYKNETDPFYDTIEYVEVERVNNSSQYQQSDLSSEESEDQNHIPLPKARRIKHKTKRSMDYETGGEGDDTNEEDNAFGDDEEYSPSTAAKQKMASNYITPTRRSRYPHQSHNPDNIDITKVSKLRSAKGGELLCVDGYIYHLKSTSNTTRTYWSCIKSKDRRLKCPARVTTVTLEGNKLTVDYLSNSHSHPISEDDIKKRLFNEFAKSSKKSFRAKDIMDKPLSELNPQFAQMLKGKSRESLSNNDTTGECEKTMLNIKLYAESNGPQSLAVRMCLQALDIPHELHIVDHVSSEHLPEEYVKNPQKEAPVLDDDGFYLSESIAIMQYLCEKYASDTNLYPKDPKERALVMHRLCFNMSSYYPKIYAYNRERSEMAKDRLENILLVLENHLKTLGKKYATGDSLTLADLSLVSSTSVLQVLEYDLSKHQLISKWYQTFKREYPLLWDIAQEGIADSKHNSEEKL